MGAHIEIALKNLEHNFANLHTFYTKSKLVHSQKPKVCVAVKADAYGHGLVECARALENPQKKSSPLPHSFGVASPTAIALLKQAKIKTPLLLYSVASVADLQKLFVQKNNKNVEFFVGDTKYLKEIIALAKKHDVKTKIKIHLKCDTGMGRVGVLPSQFIQFYEEAIAYKNIEVAGICTHLSDSADDKVTTKQQKQFVHLIEQLKKQHAQSLQKVLLHAANSGALLWQNSCSYNLARLGIATYGVSPEPARVLPRGLQLKPVMKFCADVVVVKKVPKNHSISYSSTYKVKKDTHIAIINAGYGDGIPIALSNTGFVNIKNKNYPIAGRVCMDMLMVDIGNNARKIQRGDQAVLWGDENLTVESQAQRAKTIAYELLCNMGIVSRGVRKFV